MKCFLKFIFPFLRSGVEAKRGVEFCHSTRDASRIRQKVGNGVSQHKVPSAYPAVCGIQREADHVFLNIYITSIFVYNHVMKNVFGYIQCYNTHLK